MSATQADVPGLYVSLGELIDMRHRVREVQLFASPNQRSPLIGLHHSKLRGRGVDFDQVRIYQPGDDVRTIDWRVTARTQEPHTKLFHEERERPIFILTEQSHRLFFGSQSLLKSVLAARTAALLSWATLAHNDRIGGLVFSDSEHLEVRPRRNKQALLQFLSRLAQVNQTLHADLADNPDILAPALRRAREVLRPGSLVMLICDERSLNDSAEQQLLLMARHIDLLLLPLSDPLDHQLPAAGMLRFSHQDTRLELDSENHDLRQAYAEQAQARQLRWQRLAQKIRAPLLPLTTARDLIEQFKDHLNQPRNGASA